MAQRQNQAKITKFGKALSFIESIFQMIDNKISHKLYLIHKLQFFSKFDQQSPTYLQVIFIGSFIFIISMIAIFLSFEAIQIAYTDQVDPTKHIVIGEKTEGIYEVIKEGIKLQLFLRKMMEIKYEKMEEESVDFRLRSPVFVCLSSKSKRIAEPIFKVICPEFEKELLYFRTDKKEFAGVTFNRSILVGNQICYSEGHSQLRQKQQLRHAFLSCIPKQIIKKSPLSYIFIEKNANELKQLKKEGCQYVMSEFLIQILVQTISKIANSTKVHEQTKIQQALEQSISKYVFAQKYLIKSFKIHNEVTNRSIVPFNLKQSTIEGFLSQQFKESLYYNISPKSWIPHEKSHQISAYIFHNASNNQLYLAKAQKLKDYANEEDFEGKTLANYISFIIDPLILALPQDKLSSLMKFSKIKSYENKKAIFNIRPYIEDLSTISQMDLSGQELTNLFKNGYYKDQKIEGVASNILSSLILNQNTKLKDFSSSFALVGKNKMDQQLHFIKDISQILQYHPLLCRVDYYSIYNSSEYKIINEQLTISNKSQIKVHLSELNPQIIRQMVQLLCDFFDHKLPLVKSIILYYRWTTKLINYYDIIIYRAKAIQTRLSSLTQYYPIPNQTILKDNILLYYFLTEQSYNYFMVPSKNIYSPSDYSTNLSMQEQKEPQNPYLLYINKTCSFGIYHLTFPIFTFLQWIKSTYKYHIIEYISMINHTFEEYIVLDKRMKIVTMNQKKNGIIIVDHAELCQALVNKPKSVKTVMIFRMKKCSEIQDVGVISSELTKKNSFQESNDELINTLFKQGSKIFDQSKQFQLYYWILQNYLRIKCQIFNLSYQTSLEFLWTLHKSISTNRHRLKQIKQTYPRQYIYLYTLPIFKDVQKIVFDYKLFEYLNVYQLFQRIINKKWNGKLESYQNSSVIACRSIIGQEIAVKIVNSLREYIDKCDQISESIYQHSEMINDSLEIIRSLTQTNNKVQQTIFPFKIFYDVFCEQIHVKNYLKIKRLNNSCNDIVVEDQFSLSLLNFQDRESISLAIEENIKIIGFNVLEDHVVMLNYDAQKGFLLQKWRIDESKLVVSQIQTIFLRNNVKITELLQNNCKNIKFYLSKAYFYLVQHLQQTVRVTRQSIQQDQDFITKQYCFSQKIHEVIIIHTQISAFLAFMNESSLQTVTFQDFIQDKNFHSHKLFLQPSQKTKIIQTNSEKNKQSYVLCFQGIKLQIISFNNSTQGQSITLQLPKKIKAVTLRDNILYIFFEKIDCLYLYSLNSGIIDKISKYFWVDPNPTEIFVKKQNLYIRGGNYMKKICLKNRIKSEGMEQC